MTDKSPAPSSRCEDCDNAAKHAYSDATTPGFFFDKCSKHRAPSSSKLETVSQPLCAECGKPESSHVHWCKCPPCAERLHKFIPAEAAPKPAESPEDWWDKVNLDPEVIKERSSEPPKTEPPPKEE